MPSQTLVSEYERLSSRHSESARELADVLVRMALATLRETMPGTRSIEAIGEYTEDWIPTLRIRRVLADEDAVLLDTEVGHSDIAVENAVDLVNSRFLDVLVDLTGDDYMGTVTIG